jgi:hypothetical protein
MVVLMSRDTLYTVTLPVLVDALPEEAEGWGTHFPGAHRTTTMAVRVIKPEEIQKRVREIFSDKEIFLFAGASQLEHAYGARDERELQESLRKVYPWVPRIMGSREVSNPKADKWAGARWDYSSLMTNALQNARLIMWFPYRGDRLSSPAVYCPEWRTAAFVMTFMGSIRVCPKCNNPFVPSADNVNYCTPAHGVAYRTARSRWKAKQRAEEEKTLKKEKQKKARNLAR